MTHKIADDTARSYSTAKAGAAASSARRSIALFHVGIAGLFATGCGEKAELPPASETTVIELPEPNPANSGGSAEVIEPPDPVEGIDQSTSIDAETAPLNADPALQQDRPPFTQPVSRGADRRPVLNQAKLERAGLRHFKSRRLSMYTDSEAMSCRDIPAAADELFAALVEYFGPLPPARDGSDFQVTGYLIDDQDTFERLGLIPVNLPPFLNGRHRGLQFWAYDQKADYYRAHLALHEATHCFMTCIRGTWGPSWYMEGMAEHFATHRRSLDGDREGEFDFGVMPARPDEFEEWGRINVIQDTVAEGRAIEIDELRRLPAEAFLKNDPYAWSWALCHFLATHPRYRDRFRELSPPALRTRLNQEFDRLFADDFREMNDEWRLFVRNLCYGYDTTRAAIDFSEGTTLSATQPRTVTIRADLGWQSSEIHVTAGERYEIAADGQFTLAQQPKPWVSEPQGITFQYSAGRPLGRLIGTIRPDDATAGGFGTDIINLGRGQVLTAPRSGTLYFRLNDDWDKLSDNRGEVVVRVGNRS
ncbi:hypothetical protein [Stratiformator vulcanicus]|nr:hypothetical protein [Stratiformator vulcanicus]